MCEEKSNLKERLEYLMKGNNKRHAATSVAVLSMAAIVTVLSVLLTGCRLAPKEQAPALGTSGSTSSQAAGSSAIQSSVENTTAQSSVGSNTSSAVDPDSIQIVNTVSKQLMQQYPDITITNEWLGEKDFEYRYVVLFGSLKTDPKQGVAQVIRFDPNCTKVLSQQKYLEPEKHGALKVIELGAKGNDMQIVDSDGNQMTFLYNTGFDLY
jgi:hypothetical protein